MKLNLGKRVWPPTPNARLIAPDSAPAVVNILDPLMESMEDRWIDVANFVEESAGGESWRYS